MPIIERDSWRQQYFENIMCPTNVDVPTEDADAYTMFPKYRHIFNRLFVAESQKLLCAPHGVKPADYPVFSKPVYNLKGLGAGARTLWNEDDYLKNEQPGHFWTQLLTGEHISTDCAVVDGEAVWWAHAEGVHGGYNVLFDHWQIGLTRPNLEHICSWWIRSHLVGYTGMVNLETIGGVVIEAHLRFTDQWPDLASPKWLDAVVGLYGYGQWNYRGDWGPGYSVVLHGTAGYDHPPDSVLRDVEAIPTITSVQITFDKNSHHLPQTDSRRLAVINCRDLSQGIRARRMMADWFFSETGN